MISASIYGRLGGDPVQRETKNGNSMVTTTVAVNAARQGDDEATEWFNVCAFGRAGDALLRHTKGDLVAAMGQMTRRRYTARDGTERESWSLTADAVMSAKTVRPGGGRPKAQPQNTGSRQGEPASRHVGADFDDQIPW